MDKPGKRWRVSAGQIKNKSKRMEIYAKQRKEKEEAKAARRAARQKEREVAEAAGEAAPAKLEPRTLDNTREFDDTFVTVDDVEVAADEAEDEFAAYFSGDKVPKLMVTTRPKPSKQVFPLISELMRVIPNMQYFKRGENTLKKMSAVAMEKGFTHLLVLNQRGKQVSKLIICHLPMGPSAAFRLTSEQLSWMIRGHGRSTSHVPEIILNNFKTRLGHRVGRLLGSLFPHDPEFVGRQVVTFHNQRDFVFVRKHRYIFAADGTKTQLQELGPRFTLKMRWLLAGTFDTQDGEYEWIHKRHQMDTTRRRFHL